MFCAPGLVFGGTEGVGFRFHVLRAQTHFRWYRGRPILFLWFLHPDMFLAVRRASRLVFMFCAPRHVSRGTEGIRSRFHILISRTRFQRYRGSRVPFSCFARQDSFFSGTEGIRSRFLFFALQGTFSAEPRVSAPIFMFCVPGLVFGDTDGVESYFHVLRARTCFQRYRGRRVPYSCFALPDSFSMEPRTSGPVFMCCAHGLVFGGVKCAGSHFLVLRS
jgi:hypothetical protein